ncbi:NAD(P)/FAD-dependent oxidoreductase [Azospirillum picis]|uniref:D-amino-acid dehydrogenase n=1 Tax=Azospirillum picis TaxID=488438 RepID=A0ABU0MVQ8_9PROT|nr:FAD-dependent oxidoreductase [Azospirillum picis]MBP2303401.1 D-amino-acid dehydrogenase [Azospirillum picis]MDQ0537273.1 D-amino-acid dehydrogenase [Azospirillum picis]
MKADVLVLGAGVVGTAVALHLQMRGRQAVLLDRRGAAGREASFGNAGLIQREAAYPYAFPRQLAALLRYAANRQTDAHYHARALPALAPFLARYWHHSHPARHVRAARAYAGLIGQCLPETRRLAEQADAAALLRPTGWLKLFRTARQQDAELRQAAELAREFGVASVPLDSAGLRLLEPDLDPDLAGALHYTDPLAVTDPGRLVDSWRTALERLGGRFLTGNGRTLRPAAAGWSVDTRDGPVQAPAAVVAMGAWSGEVVDPLGYRLPLGIKRGYHMHYELASGVTLGRPVLDAAHGYVLAPMARGIRLTTGAEFARPGARRTPVQLERAEPVARALFPLGARIDPEPWMGLRPCMPDMLPVIGPAPRHPGLWFAFGHGHQGLTLAAVTGRMIADMICGEAPFVDAAPFRADRPSLA